VQVPQARVSPVTLHDWPTGQAPQSRVWPQSFTRTPQLAPSAAHVFAGGAHCIVVGLQMSVAEQEPQSRVVPQPLG
jgi:hypothetical protein